MKNSLLALFMMLGVSGAEPQAKVNVLPNSLFYTEAPLSEGKVKRTVTIGQEDIKVDFVSGRGGYLRLFTISDDQSHLFWWLSIPWPSAPSPQELLDKTASFAKVHKINLSDTKIVVFWPMAPFYVKVLSSATKCEPEKQCWNLVYQELNEDLLGDGALNGRGISTIDLRGALGEDFVTRSEDKYNALPPLYVPEIESVALAGREWKLRVHGPEGHEGIITLNRRFDVVSAHRIDQKPAAATEPSANENRKR